MSSVIIVWSGPRVEWLGATAADKPIHRRGRRVHGGNASGNHPMNSWGCDVVSCCSRTPPLPKMKRTFLLSLLCLLSYGAGRLRRGNRVPRRQRPQGTEPVSYASVTQLNGLLAQLEASSKNTQADLVKLRIERWKTDGGTKRQALSRVDSIQRNLQGALPEIIAQLRAAPEDLPATFKLYRNLDALFEVSWAWWRTWGHSDRKTICSRSRTI